MQAEINEIRSQVRALKQMFFASLGEWLLLNDCWQQRVFRVFLMSFVRSSLKLRMVKAKLLCCSARTSRESS
jgi:hypothetical protein